MGKIERQERLRHSLAAGEGVQLGVGPMSRSCVDALINVANHYEIPLMLIASRRQIECQALGGGYVNGWTTESFAEYVRSRDQGGFVLLCRDHGGPWQNYTEVDQQLGVDEAMRSAKQSFQVDIESKFDLLHLDPSISPEWVMNKPTPLVLLQELYGFCLEQARAINHTVLFEVGEEEQTGIFHSVEELNSELSSIRDFCRGMDSPMPLFVVAQTGTLVRETQNTGHCSHISCEQELKSVQERLTRIVQAARAFGVYIKEHNADYLNQTNLKMRQKAGIGGLNIAPEMGVAESRFIINLCHELDLSIECEQFMALAYETRKWEKWMLPETDADDRQRAIIAGHYVFGTPEFAEISARIKAVAAFRGIDFDLALREHIAGIVVGYLNSLRSMN